MRRQQWIKGLVAIALIALTAEATWGQSGDYDRIEEDWEVVIGEPSPADAAPQIINVISPYGNQSGEFYVFEMNHRTQPDYEAGGMQIQRWYGDYVQSWKTKPNYSQLATAGETITYTMRMRIVDNDLYVSVRDGQSQTWGEFGGEELRLWNPYAPSNLNGYRRSHSVANSRIGFASYRVTRFVLKEVRYYSDGELVHTDENDQLVHEYNP